MTITYADQAPPSTKHHKLLQAAHPEWSLDHQNRVVSAFAASHFAATAWADQTLIGTVRVFSDSVGFAVIADLLVHPDYRRQGIGSELVSMVKQVFRGYYLYADPQDDHLADFYQQAGFAARSVWRLVPPQ